MSPREKKLYDLIYQQHSSFELCYGVGCKDCFYTGFNGRTGIFEIMVLNEKIQEQVLAQQSVSIIHQTALDSGMQSITDDAIFKILNGVTSISEAARVLDL